jgi:hypothetical protein
MKDLLLLKDETLNINKNYSQQAVWLYVGATNICSTFCSWFCFSSGATNNAGQWNKQ